MIHPQRRRGLMLSIVVMVMALVGGLIALLAMNAAHLYRQRQAERVRCVSREIADSATRYARAHLTSWTTTQPDKPVELDVRSLLPGKMNGAATLSFVPLDNRKVCRISVRAEWGACASVRKMDITMTKQ